MTEAALVRVEWAGREEVRSGRDVEDGRRVRRRENRGDSDVDDDDSTGETPALTDENPKLGKSDAHGHVRGDSRPEHGAGRCVDSRRYINGDDAAGGRALVGNSYDLGQVTGDRSCLSGPQESVDDNAGSCDEHSEDGAIRIVVGASRRPRGWRIAAAIRVNGHSPPGCLHDPGRDQAIAAVVSGTGKDEDVSRTTDIVYDASNLSAGSLHDVREIRTPRNGLGLDPPHFSRRDEFHESRFQAMTTATASVRE